jgi:hypothetical protein
MWEQVSHPCKAAGELYFPEETPFDIYSGYVPKGLAQIQFCTSNSLSMRMEKYLCVVQTESNLNWNSNTLLRVQLQNDRLSLVLHVSLSSIRRPPAPSFPQGNFVAFLRYPFLISIYNCEIA